MTNTPFTLVRPAGKPAGPLFLCDHAANAVPERYGTLGLPLQLLASHIAYDIGAATVTRILAARFASTAILARWSRLLIDLNRGADDPTLVMKLSDGSIIPGNRAADGREIADRLAAFHAPYHAAIATEIAATAPPALVSIHSFTPVWKGCQRKWPVAVLSGRDRRLAEPLLARLRAAGFEAGDNQPYAGGMPGDTLDRHGADRVHGLIEIRQDLIATPAAAAAFAARLAPILAGALADLGLAGETMHS